MPVPSARGMRFVLDSPPNALARYPTRSEPGIPFPAVPPDGTEDAFVSRVDDRACSNSRYPPIQRAVIGMSNQSDAKAFCGSGLDGSYPRLYSVSAVGARASRYSDTALSLHRPESTTLADAIYITCPGVCHAQPAISYRISLILLLVLLVSTGGWT